MIKRILVLLPAVVLLGSCGLKVGNVDLGKIYDTVDATIDANKTYTLEEELEKEKELADEADAAGLAPPLATAGAMMALSHKDAADQHRAEHEAAKKAKDKDDSQDKKIR